MEAHPKKIFKFKKELIEKQEPLIDIKEDHPTPATETQDPFDGSDSFLIASMENFENKMEAVGCDTPTTSTPKKKRSQSEEEVFGDSVKGFVRSKRDKNVKEASELPKRQKTSEIQTKTPVASSSKSVVMLYADASTQTSSSKSSLTAAQKWKVLRTIENSASLTDNALLDLACNEEVEQYLQEFQLKINMALTAKVLKEELKD